ncbi:MAG: hypothetical protein HQL11_05045 [Candidatus Omnitrophica bacterium]|nr:hypothetical protein [Candidatus Omnitrophota bacterium]
MKIRSILLHTGLTLGVLILSWLLAEVVLNRVFYHFERYPSFPGQGVPFVIQTLEFKIHTIENRQGLRGPEVPEKEPGEYRVICLGDSFTFGMGVEFPQTYPMVLEELLRRDFPSVRVINAGGGGAVKNRYEYMLSRGLEFDPDWAVLQIYVGNDFYDSMAASPAAESAAQKSADPGVPLLTRLKDWVREHSAIGRLLWHAMTRHDWAQKLLFKHNLRYSNRAIYLKEYPRMEEELVKLHGEYLGKLRRLLEDHGIGLTVMIVPEKMQIFNAEDLTDELYDIRKPDRLIREDCARLGITVMDLLDAYRDVPRKLLKRLYYFQDMHWTPAGHRDAAERLARLLEREWAAAGGSAGPRSAERS